MHKTQVLLLTIACAIGVRANAATVAVTYAFNGAPTAPPVQVGITLLVDSLSTGSILSGNPSLNALWNPVVFSDRSVIDLTNGMLNGTFTLTFADGNTLTGNLFEDVSQVLATFTGPFTQVFTFAGGTGEFAGATGSLSGGGLLGASGFSVSGSGTINAPAIPEPASASLLVAGFAVLLGAGRSRWARR